MRGLYSRVFGLTLDSAGAYHLRQLLDLGTKQYRNWTNQWLCNNDDAYSLDKHGDLRYLGAPVIPCLAPEYHDLAYEVYGLIKSTGRVPYVACSPEYIDMVQRLMRLAITQSKKYREVGRTERRKIVAEHIVPISPYRSRRQVYPLIPSEYHNNDYAAFLIPIHDTDEQDIISITTDDEDYTNFVIPDFYL